MGREQIPMKRPNVGMKGQDMDYTITELSEIRVEPYDIRDSLMQDTQDAIFSLCLSLDMFVYGAK